MTEFVHGMSSRLGSPVLFCLAIMQAPLARGQQAPSPQVAPTSSAAETLASASVSAPASSAATIPPGTFVHVNLAKGTRISKLKAGAEFDGQVSRPVYLIDRQVIPSGSKMHFVLNSVEKKPLPTRAFTDRISEILSFGILAERQTILQLRSATIQLPDGGPLPVQATVVRSSEIVDIHAKGTELTISNAAFPSAVSDLPNMDKMQTARKKLKELKHPALTLSLNQALEIATPAGARGNAPGNTANAITVAWKPGQVARVRAGTPATLLLLTKLDANKSKVGDPFEARLTEPVVENGEVLLPAGARFYGQVTRVKHATIGRRSAALLLRLDRVAVGDGPDVSISASLTSMETDDISRLRMDEEGGLKPRHPSKTELGRDIALAWVPGKAFNDSYDNIYPFTANFGGLAIWATMFMIHKGHDVYVPADTEIQMTFSRDCLIPTGALLGK